MSAQDKLVEALRMARTYVSDVAYDGNTVARKDVQLIDEVLQAHAAEAARAQAQSGEPLFGSDIDPKRIHNVADGLRRQGEFESARMLDSYTQLLAAAPQQAAEPVAFRYLMKISASAFAWSAWLPMDSINDRAFPGDKIEYVYTHPQPARDAKDAERYRWLRDSADSYTWDYLGGIGANRVDAAVDAAMAKESGR